MLSETDPNSTNTGKKNRVTSYPKGPISPSFANVPTEEPDSNENKTQTDDCDKDF